MKHRLSTPCHRRAGRAGLALASLLAVAPPAFAHHMMGGRMPATFGEGLLSGLGHPLIGLDHFAFIVALGLLAVGPARRLLIPAAFVALTVIGTGLHLLRIDLASVEVIVAASVFVAGVLLALHRRYPVGLLLPLAAVAGIVHGYAYGASIVGAEPTPLAAYLLGFSLVQFALALGVRQFGNRLAEAASHARVQQLARVAGTAVCGIGVVLFSLALRTI